MGDRTLVDTIYAAFGGSRASDGNCMSTSIVTLLSLTQHRFSSRITDYLRCDMPLALSFTFNGKQYPVHPLDMSDYSSADPSHKTCLGLIQYATGLTAGDV
jgi:hypothetical protein